MSHLNIESYVILINSCKQFAFLKPQLLIVIQQRIAFYPKTYGELIMTKYVTQRFNISFAKEKEIFESGIGQISKFLLPLLDHYMTDETISEMLITAIKDDDFDALRILILLVSPRRVVVPCSYINLEIRERLFEIANIRNNNLIFDYPLFFLQFFGATPNMIKRVMLLLEQIDTLQYILYQKEFLGQSYLGTVSNKPTMIQKQNLSKAIKQYSPKLVSQFTKLCESNNSKYKNLTIQEQTVFGSLVAY